MPQTAQDVSPRPRSDRSRSESSLGESERAAVVPIAKAKRTMSASSRHKIAAAQRARWAKLRRGNKAALSYR
jgi:hypothetical protein